MREKYYPPTVKKKFIKGRTKLKGFFGLKPNSVYKWLLKQYLNG